MGVDKFVTSSQSSTGGAKGDVIGDVGYSTFLADI